MPTSLPLAVQLGAWISGLRMEDLPESSVEKVRCAFLDWLGSAFVGSAHPTSDAYVAAAKALSWRGGWEVVGRRDLLSLPMAVFINGVFGHIAETDDGHRSSVIHPGAVVFPVLLCLAPDAKEPGRAFIEGAVAGYELAIRVGEALGKDHYTCWQTTATAGVLGAAAAAAKVLGLSQEQCVAALGLAGTQSSGLWQFLDDECFTAKPFQPGKACLDGLMAATLAKEGIQGAPRIFEGTRGLFAALGRNPMPEKLIENLGRQFKINDVCFKAYPTCGQTHSMIDALDSIMRQHHPNPAAVDRIEAHVYPQAVQIAGIRHPANLDEAKFSIPFCLAHYLLFGALPFSGLSEDDVNHVPTRALMERVQLIAEDSMEEGFPATRPCRIKVVMNDGTSYEASSLYRKGDPENPVDFAFLTDKFLQLTAGVLDPIQSRAFIDAIQRLPTFRRLPNLYAGTC